MTIPDGILELGWMKVNIYIYIRKKCGKKSECEVSMKEIADEFGLKRPTVSRYLQELYQKGFLYPNGHQADTKRTLISLKPSVLSSVCGHQTDTKRTLEERKRDFIEALRPYKNKYGSDMLNAFYVYWSQVNEGDDKMLWEKVKKQKSFEIPNRLATWKRNNYGDKNNTPTLEDRLTKAAKIMADD